MKRLSAIFLVSFLLFACKKDVDEPKSGSINGGLIASNALAPLPCHSISFTTNYTVLPGKVPPFRFTKTLYPDTRVKTIDMLSRANPVYPGYPARAYELKGTFTYGTNAGTLIGTMQLWEYYKTSTGAAGKKSISKKSISWSFKFNRKGYVYSAIDNYYPGDVWSAEMKFYYDMNESQITYMENVNGNSYDLTVDKYGNPLGYTPTWYSYCHAPRVNYTYDYSISTKGKRYSYIPTQNWFGPLYTMCEVMQWLPQSTHQRKSVSGEFYPKPGGCPDCCGGGAYVPGPKILQTQYYRNHKFDSKGNLISYTYADNVLQKTTWYCK